MYPLTKTALLGLACTLLILAAPATRAAADPERKWYTLSTPHFEIHSYDQSEELAERVAAEAENAYGVLTAFFDWRPKETIHIRVVDEVDAANGYAYVTPYPGMTLYAFPPESDSELAVSGDWLRMLVFHELAHIIHLDSAGGGLVWLNQLVGRAFKPNQFMPRWLTEGIATWLEGRAAGVGRVGSTRYEMFLRTAALSGTLLSLEELGGTPLTQPRRAAWYVYGSAVVSTIARDAGPQALAQFVRQYGERLIPFGLNIASRRTTGKDLQFWFDKSMEEVRQRAQAQAARLRQQGLIVGEQLTHSGEFKSNPTYTTDGTQLLYQRGYPQRRSRIVRAPCERPDDARPVIRCDGGCGRFALSRDGQELLISLGRPFRHVNWYSELLRIPLAEQSMGRSAVQLTAGARVRDPALSSETQHVWAVQTAWGRTWLTELNVATGRTTRSWIPPKWSRVDQPVAHPDGERLFAVMHHEGNADLIEIELATNRWRPLTSGPSLETGLHLTDDGRWLVYASDHTGISNIYARDVSGAPDGDGRTFQLTRVLTGAFEPTTNPQGTRLLYVGWTAFGEELFELPFDPEAGIPAVIGDPAPRRTLASLGRPDTLTRSAYDPFSTMRPRFWLPTFSVDGTGLWTTSLTIGGTDITERFGLSGQVAYRSDVPDLSVGVEARASWSYPDIRFSLGRLARPRAAYISDVVRPFVEQVFHAGVEIGLAVPHPTYSLGLTASFAVNVPLPRDNPLFEHSPDENLPFIPPSGIFTAARVTLYLSDLEQGPLSLWPTRGFSSELSLRFSLPQLGSHSLNYDLTYLLHGYIPVVDALGHVMALRLGGGFAGGRRGDVEPFVLGGVPEQDLISALMNQSHASGVYLRGFPANAFAGRNYHHGTVEYRLPVWRPRAGLDTLPVFAQDLSLAVFSDVALVYDDEGMRNVLNTLHGGIGVEARLSADIPVSQRVRLSIGYAYGLGALGLHHVYVLLGPAQ